MIAAAIRNQWNRLLRYWLRSSKKKTIKIRRRGVVWELEPLSCITEDIACHGTFEPVTTQRVLELLRPGMTVIDVGANVGYFSVLMGKAVMPGGRVIAFEPTKHFRSLCERNICRNAVSVVELRAEALSDEKGETEIAIGSASATLHWPSVSPLPRMNEVIKTSRLDDLFDELRLTALDFVKVDIDGHEPAFLRGAERTLRTYRPVLVIEFAQHCLYEAASSALELRAQLAELGYELVSEKTMKPYRSELEFLMECGNYAFSANAFAIPK